MDRNDKEFLVQKIRTQYTEKEHTQLDELRALDAKVKRPAKVFAYIFGSAGAILMGSGMSLIMTDIGALVGIERTMLYGNVVGIAGMLIAIINYPIYKRLLSSRIKKHAARVMELSDEILAKTETKL